ncbi:hypothetical protein GCM10009775_20340 [Microbacterium aoyamense]|uniref:Glycosyl hydrolase family 67 C-terminus n=1 Tax=Microbacterium aoyamense TaxID=344166 RepID=A0ABN2PT82_9MICO|nr:hypothetical protein [Microbacterium aoyamense]
MTKATRRGVLAVVTAIVLLALGLGVGVVVGDALGIRTEPSAQMTPAEEVIPAVSEAIAPPTFTTIDIPVDPRTDLAVQDLESAVQDAAATAGEASLTVVVLDGADDDTYTLAGAPDALRIEASSVTGAVRGIYDLSAQIRSGRSVAEHLGETVTSRLPFRMVDLGAVGVEPDPALWEAGDDYSHVSRAFEEVYLEEAPYIDRESLADAYDDWEQFLARSLANGYNAVAWPGFVEYATFDDVEGGPIYPEGDAHVARSLALRDAFGPFWDRAAELGVKVFLRTDMPTLTPTMNDWFVDRLGSLATEDPRLWQTYAEGLDELYAAEPGLSGILIRIGEGGDIYKEPGWDYYSAIAVRTPEAVRTMLESYTAQAEASGREVIFRTWSVGIGAVGDMHTDADSYHAVLDGIDSPALIVSTKYTLGDYYSWLPLNDTLETGDQRRIVEFQSKREFESLGAFPNDLGAEFQWAIQTLLAANPRIEGVWTWTQDGGPWRAGPMILYLKAGFWQLSELNTQVAAAIARDPAVDVGGVTVDWAREFFSDDPATVTAIAEAMTYSHAAVKNGLYLGPFAEVRAFALGLEPPPQMWLFEWDILTGDSATLDVLYTIIGADRIDETIAQGEAAVADAERMLGLVEGTDAATWRDPEMREAFVGALEYEVDTLTLLSSYREMFLRQAQWHDTLSPDVHAQWLGARDEYVARAHHHLEWYASDVAHPAWNLTAAQLGVDRADRDLAMAWFARILLLLAAAWVVIGMLAARTRLVAKPGAAAARAAWIASTRPWRARESTLGMLRLDRWLLLGVPVALLVATRAVQTSFLSWSHLLVVLAAWTIFALAVRLFVGRRSPWPVIAAVGGVVVLRCIVTLFALSFSGPGGYWFAFWTDPTLRVTYITIAFALFVWVFVAAGWALSAQLGTRRAWGAVLASVGAGLLIPALVIGAVGIEGALTIWNDELGLLPWGLARILGITTYLEIPDATAWYGAGFAAVLVVAGVLLALPKRRARAAAS